MAAEILREMFLRDTMWKTRDKRWKGMGVKGAGRGGRGGRGWWRTEEWEKERYEINLTVVEFYAYRINNGIPRSDFQHKHFTKIIIDITATHGTAIRQRRIQTHFRLLWLFTDAREGGRRALKKTPGNESAITFFPHHAKQSYGHANNNSAPLRGSTTPRSRLPLC